MGIQRSSIYWKNFSFFYRYKVISPLASRSNKSASKTLPTKSFLSQEAGAVISSCNTSGLAWRIEFIHRLSSALSGSNMYRSSSRPLLLEHPQAALWISHLHDITVDPVECSRGLLGYFLLYKWIVLKAILVIRSLENGYQPVLSSAPGSGGGAAWRPYPSFLLFSP